VLERQKISNETNFNRKRLHTYVRTKGYKKNAPSESRVKRMGCGEKRMSREEGLI